jgi:hypothetical protein
MTDKTGGLESDKSAHARSAATTDRNGRKILRAPVGSKRDVEQGIHAADTASMRVAAEEPRAKLPEYLKVEDGAERRRGVSANVRLAVLAVMIVVVGAAAGFTGSSFLPKQYAARAELKYSLSESMPNALLREDRQLVTQQVLLQGRAVLGPVASANGMTPEELTGNVTAIVLDNSEIIGVEVRDRTRERAQWLLSEIISRYLALANSDWQDPVRFYVESQLAPVRSHLEVQLSEVQKQLQSPALAPGNAADLAQREQALRGLLDRVQVKPPDPKAPSGPPAQVLTGPYPVAAQVSPKPVFAAAAGAAVALMVAGFVVLLVVRRRLRS